MNAAASLPSQAFQLALTGHVVLVTGAASGIGRATALACGRAGARVAINHLGRAEEAGALVAELEAGGARAFAVEADVSLARDVAAMVEAVTSELGPIDALVNNAGVIQDRPFLETTEADWDRMLDTDLKSVFLMCKAVLPGMLARQAGVIVNIASDLGILGRAQFAPYCAAKAGVIGLTRSLAREFAPDIRVNAIAPGLVDTPLTRDWTAMQALWRDRAPMRRAASPEDIAELASLMIASGYLTGEILMADGGYNLT